MKWVLLILVMGEPKIDATYDDRATCHVVASRINTQSTPGVRAHCPPLPLGSVSHCSVIGTLCGMGLPLLSEERR